MLTRLLIVVIPTCRQIVKTKLLGKVETFKLRNDGMNGYCDCFYKRIGVVSPSSYKNIHNKFILLQENHKHMKDNGGDIVLNLLQIVQAA